MSAEEPIRLAIPPGPFVGMLVSRLLGIAAARADLPLDRVDDARLLAAAVAARIPEHLEATGDRIQVEVRTRPGALEFGVAPLRPGAVERLLGPAGDGQRSIFRSVASRAERGRDASGAEQLVLEIACA